MLQKYRKLQPENESTVLSEDLNMDVTWAFPRMQQAWLMQSVISADNMQIVSGLGVYQSILNPAVLQISKIGYCTMIEGSCTDFSALYTVLKLAKMVSDVLEQYDVIITFDIVIFIQGKKIQMKFPQEFLNTVIRHGG